MNQIIASILILLLLPILTWGKGKPQRYFNSYQKNIIWERDKGICQICRIKLKPYGRDKDSVEFDHFYPYSKGYPTTIDNGVLLCRLHNQEKSNNIYPISVLIGNHKHLKKVKKQ